MQATGLLAGGYQIAYGWLDDGTASACERLDLRWTQIHSHHSVASMRQASRRYRAYIAQPENADCLAHAFNFDLSFVARVADPR